GGDGANDGIGAVGPRQARVGVAAGADRRFAGVDDRRIGEADDYVVRSRPIFLEGARLTHAEERVVGLLTIKRIGLKPLFTPANPVGPGRGNYAIASGHQVGNHRLASKR